MFSQKTPASAMPTEDVTAAPNVDSAAAASDLFDSLEVPDSVADEEMSPPVEPAVMEPLHQGVKLPSLMLLNLDVMSGPDAIESAPPLGSRAEVIAILCGVIPDLHVDDARRMLARADDSVRLKLGTVEPIATVVAEARGEAGVALVKEILLMTGWRAFAPKTGLFVGVEDLEALGALAASESEKPDA
jgi:hypothetical protein